MEFLQNSNKRRLSDDVPFVHLDQARQRVLAAVAGYGSPLFDLAETVAGYREALARCGVPDDVLARARDELAERLAVGWDASEWDRRLEERWFALLTRYEAVCDVLDVPAAHKRLATMEAQCYRVRAA